MSECPNCGRDAFGAGEEKVEGGRRYSLMKCGHCFNAFWLFRGGRAYTPR